MTLPVVHKAAKDDLSIPQGATFGPYVWRWIGDDGFGVDLVTGGITAEAVFRDDSDAVIATLSTGTGEIVIVDPILVNAQAITADFAADGIVEASGANFETNGVRPGDRVELSGTTSNDVTDARVLRVIDEDTIETDQTFTAESFAGDITVHSEGWFYFELAPSVTSGFDFNSGTWDLEFTDPSQSPATVRRPLRGTLSLELDR